MEWYWWVLIGIGVVVLGTIKIKILGKMMAKKNNQQYVDED